MIHDLKHSNLYHYYFTLLPHLLTNIIPNYSLPRTKSYLPGDATYAPSSASSIGALTPNPVFNPGLIPIKYLAEDSVLVPPTVFYTLGLHSTSISTTRSIFSLLYHASYTLHPSSSKKNIKVYTNHHNHNASFILHKPHHTRACP